MSYRKRLMTHCRQARVFITLIILARPFLCIAAEPKWIEVHSPNFTVISNDSPGQAKRTARSLEQFRSLLQAALPKLRMDSGSPLIAFALRDERGFKELLPGDALARGAATPGGLFISSPERHFVLLRNDAPVEQRYRTVYHEYVHMVMRLNFPDLPLWLHEGLAEFFGCARVSDGNSDLGMPSQQLLQTLKTGTLIPLTTMLEVSHDSPHYRERSKAAMFYAQSWALTHYLMIGDNKAHVEQLGAFLKLLQDDTPSQEAAKQAFGDLKNLERNLDRYVRSMVFYHYQVPVRLSVEEERYTVRELSAAESLAFRGAVLVHVSRLEDARSMLEEALRLDRGSAVANESMGMLYARLNDREKAGKYFAAAAAADPNNYLASYYAAQAAFERGDPALVEGYLRRSLAINPQFVPAMRILSQLLAAQLEKLPEALELAQKAAALEPADMSHRLRIAEVLAAMERTDEAAARAEKVLAIARREEDRDAAKALLSRIQEHGKKIHEAKLRAAEREKQNRRTEERIQKDRELEARLKAQQTEEQENETPAAPVKAGSSRKVSGLIRSVRCDYPAVMNLVLDSDGKLQKLHADNYYRIQFWAVDAPGKNGFEPCDELEGKHVEIEFLSVPGQEYSGMIRTVAIQK